MRLGLWNRLAIVAFVVGVPVASLVAITDKQADLDASRLSFIETCETAAGEKPNTASRLEALDTCRDLAYQSGKQNIYNVNGDHWQMYLGGFAMFGAAIYALIWITAVTAKWVWRGRTQK